MLTWAQLALAALFAAIYAWRLSALRRAGQPLPASARIASFAAGVTGIAVAVIVLDGPAAELLYMHTIEHLLIADLATLAIAFGLTGRMLTRTGAERPPGWLRALTWPPLAVTVWMLDFAVWLWPPAYEAARAHAWLHLISHILLVLLGANLWISLLGVAGSRIGLRGRLAGILATRLFGAGLGIAAIWISSIFYPADLRDEIARATSPLADQGIAGAIMLAEMALVAIGMLVWAHARLDEANAARPVPAATAGQRPLPVDAA